MRIFLIGMPGSGKSFWGHKWARHCGLPHVDTDVWIQEKAGKTIETIFKVQGEAHFRMLEVACIKTLCQNYSNVLISTGGGLPCNKFTMNYLKEQGLTIYLKLPLQTLMHNLQKDQSSRPLLPEIPQRESLMQQLLEERRLWYEQAEIVLEEPDMNTPTFLKRIEQYVKN